MSRVRLVQSAPATVTQLAHGIARQISGSMGSAGQIVPQGPVTMEVQPSERFETSQLADDAWQAEVRRREQAEALQRQTSQPLAVPAPGIVSVPTPFHIGPIEPIAAADLTGLPDSFCLEVEKKAGTWKVSAPAAHIGLFVADRDLTAALARAPAVLAEILRLDGPVPRPKERKRTKPLTR